MSEALLEVAVENFPFAVEEAFAPLADAHGGTTGGEQLLEAQEIVGKVVAAGNGIGFRRGLSREIRLPCEQVEHLLREPAQAICRLLGRKRRFRRAQAGAIDGADQAGLRNPRFDARLEVRADDVVVLRLALSRGCGGLFVAPRRAGEHEAAGAVDDPRDKGLSMGAGAKLDLLGEEKRNGPAEAAARIGELMLGALGVRRHCRAAAKKGDAQRPGILGREKLGGGGDGLQPDRAVHDEHGDLQLLLLHRGCGGDACFGNLGVPVSEVRFPVRALEGVKLVEDRASRVELAEIDVSLDEVVSDLQAVNRGIESGAGDFEQFDEVAGIAEIAADLHEGVRRDRVHAGESLPVKIESPRKIAPPESRPPQPELGAPAAGNRGDPAQGFEARLLSATLTVDHLIPAHAVVLIRIEFQRVPEQRLGLRIVALFGVNLGEVRENDAFFSMPGRVILENGFGLCEPAFLIQDNAPNARTADVIGIDLVEVLRGFHHVGAEAVVQRAEDHLIKLIRLVPGFLDVAEEHGVPPFLAGDEKLAPVGVVHADEVRILRGINRRQWWRSGGRGRGRGVFLAKKFAEEAHAARTELSSARSVGNCSPKSWWA